MPVYRSPDLTAPFQPAHDATPARAGADAGQGPSFLLLTLRASDPSRGTQPVYKSASAVAAATDIYGKQIPDDRGTPEQPLCDEL